MRILFTLLALFFSSAQNHAQELFDTPPKQEPDTLYFAYKDGIQLIIIDNFDTHRRYGSWMDAMFPRGGSWFQDNGPALKNVYVFRDTEGKIIRRYNSESVDETGFKGTTFINTNEFTLNSIFDYVELNHHLMYHDDNSKVGLINLQGEIVVPATYDRIRKFQDSPGKRDKLVAIKDNRFGFLDSNLKVVFPTVYRAEVDSSYVGYPEHRQIDGENLLVFLGDKCGLINEEGKVLIDFLFDDIQFIHDGMYMGLIFRNEKEITHAITNYWNGGYRFKTCVVYDKDFQALTKLENYEFIQYSGIKKFVVKKNNKYGIVNYLGQILVSLEYDMISEWSGAYYVTKSNRSGVLNLEGQLVIPCEYELIDFQGEAIYVTQNGLIGVYNRRYEIIAEPQFIQRTWDEGKFVLTGKDGAKAFVKHEKDNSYYQSPEGEIIKLQ